ncbi:MAG: PilZ domain-containing protein [Nitrospirota bacterium]
MDKRSSNRKKVNLHAEVILESEYHLGFIENISEEGMFMRTAPTAAAPSFSPGAVINLKVQLPSGEDLNMRCRVVWSYKTPHEGLASRIITPVPEYTAMGMQIIDAPAKYQEFIATI